MMTDPIADMLTRIRNGNNARHPSEEIKLNNINELKEAVTKLICNSFFYIIKNYNYTIL